MKFFYTTIARMLAAGVLMAITGSAVAQQAYPNKPIRFITPYAPGGSTTIVIRLVGQKLTDNCVTPWGEAITSPHLDRVQKGLSGYDVNGSRPW